MNPFLSGFVDELEKEAVSPKVKGALIGATMLASMPFMPAPTSVESAGHRKAEIAHEERRVKRWPNQESYDWIEKQRSIASHELTPGLHQPKQWRKSIGKALQGARRTIMGR